MKLASTFALAVAVIAIGGATGGAVIAAQIGNIEILQRENVGGERPQYDFQAEYDSGIASRNAERPRDHYAIETPEGRFEVAELRERGLYRNRRHSAYDAALAAEDRAWEEDMAALERGDWQPDPRFADREWNRAGGPRYERDSYGVTIVRHASSRTGANEAIAQPQQQALRPIAATTPVIGPDQVAPLVLPAPLTLPAPSAPSE